MNLEKALNGLTPFRNEQEKAIVNLVFTYNHLLAITQKTLKEFNINDQHYNILKILEEQHPKSLQVGTIKTRLLNKRGDLTRLLDKLNKMGLIIRKTNPQNRRMVDIFLSDKGIEQLALMDSKLAAHDSRRNNLSENEARQLNHLLDKLRG